MKTLEVAVEGMHCYGCASTIQALLSHEAGVKSADVSFGNSKARVLYDPDQTDPVKVMAVIEKTGYRATAIQSTAAA